MTRNEERPAARVLAFYLPQFHPIPENDKWWGKGFTEWTNVGKAKKLFPGHYQPRVPADLGYYDLRVPETRQAQADLARQYGIEGFVYWHYWFGNGKRLLERPFNEVLASGKPDFPFALAWANESWEGFWHGLKDRNLLIEQQYPGEEDYIAHFKSILPALKDPRYITCDGRSVFFVFKPFQLPDVRMFIELWRKLACENGLKGIYFVAITYDWFDRKRGEEEYRKLKQFGFDAINVNNMFAPAEGWWRTAIRNVFHVKLKLIPHLIPYTPGIAATPWDGQEDVIPTVVAGWDHTPRTGKEGCVFVNFTPERFQRDVEGVISRITGKPIERRFLLVKSWNEWAEGNYLEPDLRYGHGLLQALRNAICVTRHP